MHAWKESYESISESLLWTTRRYIGLRKINTISSLKKVEWDPDGRRDEEIISIFHLVLNLELNYLIMIESFYTFLVLQ